jgi:hypothetical protein
MYSYKHCVDMHENFKICRNGKKIYSKINCNALYIFVCIYSHTYKFISFDTYNYGPNSYLCI